jgi:hypothetical protein
MGGICGAEAIVLLIQRVSVFFSVRGGTVSWHENATFCANPGRWFGIWAHRTGIVGDDGWGGLKEDFVVSSCFFVVVISVDERQVVKQWTDKRPALFSSCHDDHCWP